ncbi:MAG: LysR family transcriptional regulator [Planctomycetota bacterium]
MQTLRLFADIARCHSFSQAAEFHGISQSAASQRLNQLEKKLGVQLIDRSVRPLELTEPGKLFLLGIDDVLRRYDRLERRVAAAAAPAVGQVRVSAIYSSGIDLLQQIAEEFKAEAPHLDLQIDYDKPDAVYDAVVHGRADVGMLSYPDRFKKIAVVALRDEEMAVVCPPGHALAGRTSVQVKHLAGHEMVGFDPDLPVGRRILAYFKEHGLTPRTALSFDNLDTIKSATAATGRFAILPRRTVGREVNAGTLTAANLTPRLTRPMGLIYRKPARAGAALPPATARFIEFLIQHTDPAEAPAASASASPTRPVSSAPPLVGAKP